MPVDSTFDRIYAGNVRTIERRGPLTIFVVGRTGAGKSSTINTLLRSRAANESEHDVGTFHVGSYRGSWRGLPVLIYDTPGFGDAREEDQNDEKYLAEIAAIREQPDVIVHANSLNEQRANNVVDESALQLIVQHFGPRNLLASMVFVFTFADKHRDRFELWSREQYKRFGRIARVETIEATTIPAVKVHNTGEPESRIREADELWMQLLDRCGRMRSLPLLRLGALRSSDSHHS